jgi:ArsR family transcriptional regulator
MPLAKTVDFEDTEVQLAAYAKALAHPARIAILRELARRGTCICGEIVEVLPLAQSTVSQHLKALKEAGLIQGEIEGQRSCYCLNTQALRVLQQGFAALTQALIRMPEVSAKQDSNTISNRPKCC